MLSAVCSSGDMRWEWLPLARTLTLFRLCLFVSSFLYPVFQLAAQNTADEMLAQGDRFGAVGNWTIAGPYYARAEQLFGVAGDRANELRAKFGRLQRDVLSGSYVAVKQEVEKHMDEEVVRTDPQLRIRALALKGLINMNLNTSAAKEDWGEVLRLAKQLGDRKWENRASGQLGLIAGVEGDYSTAMFQLLAAIKTASQIKDVGAELYFRTFLANGLTVNNHPGQALRLYDAALELAKANPDSGFPLQPYLGKIRALRASGQTAEAKQLIEQALQFASGHDIRGGQAELLIQAGRIALAEKDLTRAEAALQQTLAVTRKAVLPRVAGEALSILAEIYTARGDTARALTAISDAIALLRQTEENYDLPQLLATKANILAKLGKVAAATALYDEAREIVEGMLVNMPSSLARSSLIATMSQVYTGHFRFAVEQNDLAKAFSIVEAARGRSIADLLRLSSARPAGPTTTSAELKIAGIQKEIRSTSSPARRKQLLRALDDAEADLALLASEKNRRIMRELALVRHGGVTPGAIQANLHPGEVLLEYVLADPVSFCLLITKRGITVHKLASQKAIEQAATQFVTSIRAKKDGKAPARLLYEQLIAPLPNAARTARKLIVVGDGILHSVPFAAFVAADGRYLIEICEIAYAPSATVLHVLRAPRRTPAPTKSLLAVGYTAGANSPTDGKPVTRGMFDLSGADLRGLPFAKEEVNAAVRAAGNGSTVLIGDRASETTLKTMPVGQYRVLHLAAHAVNSVHHPDRAGVVLLPGGHEDGIWQAREVRSQRLRADLVTLSACETAVGKQQGQEGVNDLARTFLMAGANSVVASLWTVDDRSTATLMEAFYRHLPTSRHVAAALRNAQLDMLNQFGRDAAPYYWAAFMVIGDGSRRITF